jgi:Rps23 Pro-64 3,4-dihydroxylase Tpa1-like proline 4-hydroxylase
MRAPGEGHAWPAPFVQLRDFLPAELHDRLLRTALEGASAFDDSTVRDGDYEPELRRSRVSHEVAGVREWFLPLLRERLAEVRQRLAIAPFVIERIETQLTAHNDANFYGRHRDNDLIGVVAREISFIYYFNRTPKAFTGGELVIYDTEPGGNYVERLLTRIAPHDNSIVFFPSGYVHQVCPVSCPSRDWADSRFTFNGWVRRHLTPEEHRRAAGLEGETETAAV